MSQNKLKKGKGRPKRFTDLELKQILEKYAKEHPGKISYLQLEKVTSIKRHVWSRRMAEVINKLNQPIITQIPNSDNHTLPLPNIDEIINRFANNKKGLHDALHHVNEIIQSLYEENLKLNQKMKKIDELTDIIRNKNKEISAQQDIIKYYESLLIASTNPSIRREKQISHNVISINEKNKKKALNLDIKSEFPALFNND